VAGAQPTGTIVVATLPGVTPAGTSPAAGVPPHTARVPTVSSAHPRMNRRPAVVGRQAHANGSVAAETHASAPTATTKATAATAELPFTGAPLPYALAVALALLLAGGSLRRSAKRAEGECH
jgi:hypothetical protein